jgi:hypothetical protein
MNLDLETRARIKAIREDTEDPAVPIDRDRLPEALKTLADEAELIGSMDDCTVYAIARALPVAYLRSLEGRLNELKADIDEFLARRTEETRNEWRAFFGLRQVVAFAHIKPSPRDAPPARPWDPRPLYEALARAGARVPPFRSAEELARSIPREIVDAVFQVRARWSSPATGLDPAKVPPGLRPLIDEAELLGTSDHGLSSAIGACLPAAYVRALAERIDAVEGELRAFSRENQEKENWAFRELWLLILDVRPQS